MFDATRSPDATARPLQSSSDVHLVNWILKSVHQALRELVSFSFTPLAPVPVNSSAVRAARFPPHRSSRRFH